MRFKKLIQILAVSALAAAMLSGCAMKRDIMIIDDKINNIRSDQREMRERMDKLDSLIVADSDASLKLRAEIRSAVSELLDQAQMTQTNINDLQGKVDALAGSSAPAFVTPPRTNPLGKTEDSTATIATETLPGVNCQSLYDDAFTFVMQGNYEEGISSFQDYLKYCGTHDLADNARFWIGESYYSMEKYANAISEFDLMLSEYPDSEKKATALYKLARSHEELGHKTDAVKFFQKLVDEFPNTLEADNSRDKLKELKK
ncbi:MAG: tol-pal system protein YbgF [Candidatus Zixiibacteriota bacterium]